MGRTPRCLAARQMRPARATKVRHLPNPSLVEAWCVWVRPERGTDMSQWTEADLMGEGIAEVADLGDRCRWDRGRGGC